MTRADLQKISERPWLKTDQNVKLIAYYPFRDFYGGYLLYELNGQKFRQFLSNFAAAKLNVPKKFIYGKRAI